MAVNEGSMKSFIRNFNDMLKSYQDNYGLDKNEAAALNDAHIRGATDLTMNIAASGIGPLGELAIASNIAKNRAVNAYRDIVNSDNWFRLPESTRWTMMNKLNGREDQLVALRDTIGPKVVTPYSFAAMLGSLPASALGTAKVTEKHDPIRIDKNDKRTYKEQLQSALRKINAAGGIPAAGTFNEALNNSFIDNLRRAKKADVKEEPIRIIDKVQLPSVLNDLKPVKTIDTNILNDSNALREFLRSNGYK